MNAQNNRTRILFIDDEEAVLNSVRRALRNEPYEMHFTTDPQSALSVIEAKRIQIVVCDHSMPELTGIELLSLIAQFHPEVYRVVLTGHVDAHVAIRAINAGRVHRFLTKPWNNGTLKSVLAAAALELGGSSSVSDESDERASDVPVLTLVK